MRPGTWLVGMLLACRAWAGEPPIVDTGYTIAPRTLSRSLYWIDNRRLLFEGRKIYLWDAARRSASVYAEGSGLCVAGSVVHFARPDQAVPAPGNAAQSVYSRFDCRRHLRAELSPPARPGRRIVMLRAKDGYLDAGPVDIEARIAEMRATAGGRVRLFAPRAEPIDLPLTLGQGPGFPLYSAYLGAYVTMPLPRGSTPGRVMRWPRGLPATVYTFTRLGPAGEIVIPYGEWGAVAWPLPTSLGWIFAGQGAPTPKAGLFVYNSGDVRRLDSGWVYEIAVTPDGCRAAAAIKTQLLDINAPTHVKVLELCSR